MARYNFDLLDSGKAYTSGDLDVGATYTRDDLKSAYQIFDATINTGVFLPKGKKSIWLFVTEIKSTDKTQYHDKLDGDILTWQGQLTGRSDYLIKGHASAENEILVFYRNHKAALPHYGFQYQSVFELVDYKGSKPTTFTLKRR